MVGSYTDSLLTTLTINCYYVLVNLRNLYLHLYSTLLRLLLTNETTEHNRAIAQSKLTRLQHAAHKKRHKTDKNWVRNISSRPLDENETPLPSYGLKHSVTPKHVPTDDIVSSVESVLARQRELPESTKDDNRSRIARGGGGTQ